MADRVAYICRSEGVTLADDAFDLLAQVRGERRDGGATAAARAVRSNARR